MKKLLKSRTVARIGALMGALIVLICCLAPAVSAAAPDGTTVYPMIPFADIKLCRYADAGDMDQYYPLAWDYFIAGESIRDGWMTSEDIYGNYWYGNYFRQSAAEVVYDFFSVGCSITSVDPAANCVVMRAYNFGLTEGDLINGVQEVDFVGLNSDGDYESLSCNWFLRYLLVTYDDESKEFSEELRTATASGESFDLISFIVDCLPAGTSGDIWISSLVLMAYGGQADENPFYVSAADGTKCELRMSGIPRFDIIDDTYYRSWSVSLSDYLSNFDYGDTIINVEQVGDVDLFGWLVSPIQAFFDMRIAPNVSIGGLLAIFVTVTAVIAVLVLLRGK